MLLNESPCWLIKILFSPKRTTKTGKKVYIVHIGDRATLTLLLPRLFPYLGKRRQGQVQPCIDALALYKIWYSAGGRREMAKEGGKASANQNQP